MRISGYADIRKFGYPEIRISGNPEIRISGFSDFPSDQSSSESGELTYGTSLFDSEGLDSEEPDSEGLRFLTCPNAKFHKSQIPHRCRGFRPSSNCLDRHKIDMLVGICKPPSRKRDHIRQQDALHPALAKMATVRMARQDSDQSRQEGRLPPAVQEGRLHCLTVSFHEIDSLTQSYKT